MKGAFEQFVKEGIEDVYINKGGTAEDMLSSLSEYSYMLFFYCYLFLNIFYEYKAIKL